MWLEPAGLVFIGGIKGIAGETQESSFFSMGYSVVVKSMDSGARLLRF